MQTNSQTKSKAHTSIDLENASSVPFFTLKGHKCSAKVVHVYDGDTVHLVFEYFGQLFKWHTRIAHVDTPELRTKNLEEKKKGYEVRDKLIELIQDKIVDIVCLDFDKYGRVLAEITYNNERIDKWLIDRGYAKPYEGKTKEAW
jgi:endonuclease YncB( thermonuclease family)